MSNATKEFSETMKKDWVRAASKELGSEDPLAKLSHKNGDLTILPYYDASDLSAVSSNARITHGKPWVNAPKVIVNDVATANRTALRHLEEGADGILFEIRTPTPVSEQLVEGIELEFCSIFFNGNATQDFLKSFAGHSQRKFDPQKIRGAAYGLTIHDYGHLRRQFEPFNQFSILGIENASACLDARAIAQIFLEIQSRLSHGEKSPAIAPASILINLSDDFFGEIIRMRASTMLWTAFCAAYQQHAPLTMHCVSEPFANPAYEPHGNMIAAASRSVSAIIGGAHVLTIDPETEDPLATRIARNTSYVLHEEAHLSKAGNMSEGSYFIDAAAHSLAEKSWRLFKEGL